MAQLNSILPAKSAFYGRYAQVSNGKTFDGSQIYQMMDDIKSSGAILQASIMPYGTWYGLTESDNRNAVAIAKVCRDIYENHGVEVWLRFAHESECAIYHHPSSCLPIAYHPSSVIHPLSPNSILLIIITRPLSPVLYPSSSIIHPLSPILHHPSSITHPPHPSSNTHPLSPHPLSPHPLYNPYLRYGTV